MAGDLESLFGSPVPSPTAQPASRPAAVWEPTLPTFAPGVVSGQTPCNTSGNPLQTQHQPTISLPATILPQDLTHHQLPIQRTQYGHAAPCAFESFGRNDLDHLTVSQIQLPTPSSAPAQRSSDSVRPNGGFSGSQINPATSSSSRLTEYLDSTVTSRSNRPPNEFDVQQNAPALTRPSTASITRWAQNVLTTKNCTKCHRVRPLPEFEDMSSLGTLRTRVQCSACRQKRRRQSAQARVTKEKERRDDLLQKKADEQERERKDMPRRLHQTESPFQPFRSAPSQTEITPAPLADQRRDGIASSANNWTRSMSVTPAPSKGSAFESPDMMNLDEDLNYYFKDKPASPAVSPSAFLPPESKPPAPSDPNQGQGVQNIDDVKPAMSSRTLQARLEHERGVFDGARHKCLWMKKQDNDTLWRAWKRREATIVLGLDEVPEPERQPLIAPGKTFFEGSHNNINDC